MGQYFDEVFVDYITDKKVSRGERKAVKTSPHGWVYHTSVCVTGSLSSLKTL